MKRIHLILLVLFALLGTTLEARHILPNPDGPRPPQPNAGVRGGGGCDEARSEAFLNINNVRCLLLSGGDMWWDALGGTGLGRYIVPNVPQGQDEVSALFASAIWLGAYDDGNNLLVAAQTYRQNGNDYWPGPLDENGLTSKPICSQWDRHFEVFGQDIDQLRADFLADGTVDNDPSDGIKFWPGRGNPYFSQKYGFALPDQDLAPFIEPAATANGIYNPFEGDHPYIEVRGCADDQYDNAVYASQMIWWVYNDAGNLHTETGAEPLNMEVSVMAFAYQATDELNNMSFYRYRLNNKNALSLSQTFFSLWSDPDLGCPNDDYIGSRIDENLGFVYNSDAVDEDCTAGNDLVQGYGANPPALGVDYFRGPLGNDLLPDGTCCAEIGMTRFTYFFNNGTPQGNPTGGTQFYNLMSGFWGDGSPFYSCNDGYQDAPCPETFFMFDGDPADPNGFSMAQEALAPSDYRFLHTSGPFILPVGGFNEIISGNPWVPEIGGGAVNLQRLYEADEIAQALFDNCFSRIKGPDAPDINIVELDKELILILDNGENNSPPGLLRTGTVSNNQRLSYMERDPRIPGAEVGNLDTVYRFQGYKVYQLASQNVAPDQLEDPDFARLIYQCDLRDSVTKIFNWDVYDETGVPSVPTIYIPELMVSGVNQGIRNTIRVTEDQFAKTGNRGLVNHKKYYFVAVAYGFNNFEDFNPDPLNVSGQPNAYLSGSRNSFPPVTGIPRINDAEYFGVTLNSQYGDEPQITRFEGKGSSDQYLRIANETEVEAAALSAGIAEVIKYENGFGPFEVRVVNPLRVPQGTYQLTIFDDQPNDTLLYEQDSINWLLRNVTTGEQWTSYRTLEEDLDQVIEDIGVAIAAIQRPKPSEDATNPSGFVGSTARFTGGRWLFGINDNFPNGFDDNTDDDYPSFRFDFAAFFSPGANTVFDFLKNEATQDFGFLDPNKDYSSTALGFSPFYMNDCYGAPVPFFSANMIQTSLFGTYCDILHSPNNAGFNIVLSQMNNVNIVITPDKSKWSRSLVVETYNKFYDDAGFDPENAAWKMLYPRTYRQSVDKEGNPDNTGTVALSWFPGYAYDVETGQRLNIVFGENSFYRADNPNFIGIPALENNPDLHNGADMMYNPTSLYHLDLNNNGSDLTDATAGEIIDFVAGGQHYVYVTNSAYDECATLLNRWVTSPIGNLDNRRISWLRAAGFTWAGLLMVDDNYAVANNYNPLTGVPAEEMRIELRVTRPYDYAVGTGQNNGYPMYEFVLDGFEAGKQQPEVAKTALDLLNIVPNPYYAFSSYETTELESIVKITNVPNRCEVNIYSIDGRFIRQYKRDIPYSEEQTVITDATRTTDQIITSIDWDLKNASGVPVASGVYLVHVNVPGVGERTLKAFILNRSFDAQKL